MSETAKVFWSGNSQAVRLPKEFRFPRGVREVSVRRQGKQTQEEIYLGFAVTSGLDKVVVPFVDRGLPIEYEVVRSVATVAQNERMKLGIVRTDVPLFGGLRVFDANPRIEEALAERGRLWGRATLEHSYPHCWRCHNPVIFLATRQWFIRMDARDFRNRTLEAITKVNWLPSWGEERIHNMVATRPDWCISRQRAWGVPIPALYCTGCREPMLTVDLTNRAAEVFERLGADAWYDEPLKAFLPEGLSCPTCGGSSPARRA